LLEVERAGFAVASEEVVVGATGIEVGVGLERGAVREGVGCWGGKYSFDKH
jgi:hypothetical protein